MLDILTCIIGTFGFSILLKVSAEKLIFTVIGGTIPLLPGGSLYYTLSYLLHSDRANFYVYAKDTVLTGAGIALGAIFVSIILSFITDIRRKVEKQV